MAHMMKHTKACCGHMFAHYDRQADNISNENLDRSRTYLNYNLAVDQNMDQGEFVRKRCSEVHCQNRKDVNVMVSWIITAPKDLPAQEHKAFFQASYDFLKERYGSENTVSSWVHMDEVQPHMHYAFVPVVYDKKKERYKVSAKEKVDRRDLQTFHEDLSKHLEKSLGHEVSILNEATKEGNRSIQELKRESAIERLQEATTEASKIVSEALNQSEAINNSLAPIQAEYEAKKAYVESMSKDFALTGEGVQENRSFLGGKVKSYTVSADKWETQAVTKMDRIAQIQADQAFMRSVEEFKNTNTYQKHIELVDQVDELKRENLSLRKKNQKLQHRLDRANRAISRLPKNIRDQLLKITEELDLEQNANRKINFRKGEVHGE